MESKQFRKLFSELATENEFVSVPGGWYKDTAETLVILQLQASQYSRFYYLNIKIYIHGTFEEKYVPNKFYVAKHPGSILSRQPTIYNEIFDLDNEISDEARKSLLKSFFNDYLNESYESFKSVEGILQLEKSGKLNILDVVKNKLREVGKMK